MATVVPVVQAQPMQAQPVQAQPVQAQPVQAQPMMAPHVMAQPVQGQVVQGQVYQPQQSSAYVAASCPPGGMPGGHWFQEQFIGCITMIMVIIILFCAWPIFWLPFLCPCDNRTRPRRAHPPAPAPPARALRPPRRSRVRAGMVYQDPTGVKLTRSGARVPPGSDCCGHPCGGPAA